MQFYIATNTPSVLYIHYQYILVLLLLVFFLVPRIITISVCVCSSQVIDVKHSSMANVNTSKGAFDVWASLTKHSCVQWKVISTSISRVHFLKKQWPCLFNPLHLTVSRLGFKGRAFARRGGKGYSRAAHAGRQCADALCYR